MGFTLKRPLSFEGTGIHSGQSVRMTLVPQASGGIRFKHLRSGTKISLNWRYIKPLNLGTNLFRKGAWIRTIEHFCSALWATELTDLLIEVEGDEIPVQDGSSQEYVDKIRAIGRRRTDTHRATIKLTEPQTEFFGPEAFIMAFPAKKLSIQYFIHFPGNPIQAQYVNFSGREEYSSAIQMARTFGNIEDVEYLHGQGLALGASMENALVYDSEEFLNEPRFENESVRHKVLDLIGDIYASGYDLRGRIIAFKSSHMTNYQFMKKLIHQAT